MKQSFIAFLAGALITGAVLYFMFGQKVSDQVHGESHSVNADTIIKGKNYVVIRTDTLSGIVKKADDPIHPERAQEMIKAYLATSTNSSPHYISFSFEEVFNYMADIKQHVNPAGFGLRFYFGLHTANTATPTHPEGTLSLILVATDASKVDYYTDQIRPIDYGNLCPPSQNCIDSADSRQLIYRARRMQ